MNRIARGVVILLLLLSMSGTAGAQEGTRVFVSFRSWINNWRNETPGSESVRSNTTALVGWEFEADFSNGVFFDASYLMSVADYEFDPTVITAQVERTDFDAAFGYQFNRYAGAFAGYRSSQFKDNLTERRETASGPLVGVRGAVPVTENLSLVAKLIGLPMIDKATFTEPEQRERARGWIGEAGITYAFTPRTSGALGYKYELSTGKNTRIKDTFAGTTFGVTYRFQ
jgi:hypothetical protein